MSVPIPESYSVWEGRLLAGEYPGAKHVGDAVPRLDAFRAAGITSFVDLTEEDEGLTPTSNCSTVACGISAFRSGTTVVHRPMRCVRSWPPSTPSSTPTGSCTSTVGVATDARAP